MTVLFIVNPASGSGGPVDRLPAIAAGCRRRGISFAVCRTAAAGSAARIIRESMATLPGLDRVVAVGGDGTASEVAAALVGTGLAMGIVPLGTGNDFSRAAGLPDGRDVDACLDVVLNAPPRRIDAARYRTDSESGVFLNAASAGFDAAVTRSARRLKRRLKSRFIYFLAIPAALPDLRFHDIHMEVDGIRLRRRALLAAAANGRRYGGGIRINPDGELDDGRLDLIVYRPASPLQMIATLPSFLKGRHRRLDYIETRRCRSARIMAETPLPVNVDGEMRGATPLEVEVIPGGLTILAPMRAKRSKSLGP